MVEPLPAVNQLFKNTEEILLSNDECIVVASTSEQISAELQDLLTEFDLPFTVASTIDQIIGQLNNHRTALALLDLSLIEESSTSVLNRLHRDHRELGIIAVEPSPKFEPFLGQEVDRYLAGPLNGAALYQAVAEVLYKRALRAESQALRRELQLANLRTLFLHHLMVIMNSGYLSEVELEAVLKTILIGITSEEGLAFNRAFLALFSGDGSILKGELAIGPDNRADALAIWKKIKTEKLDLQTLFQRSSEDLKEANGVVNKIVQTLEIPASRNDHPLIHACQTRRSILVDKGSADVHIPAELIATLNQDSFVIVPLFSPDRSLGVIIADNFITRKPIEQSDVRALEMFGAQASLAIEHSRLYHDMQEKIEELEQITEELEKSRDQLLESERFTVLGQMSAQLVHALRNPITSIGGTARLLGKRVSEQKNRRFLKVLTKESAKVESTLNDLFNFVSDTNLQKNEQPLFAIVKRAGMVFYSAMKKQDIIYRVMLPEEDLLFEIDGDKIHQAFLHLIRNSIESMDAGGVLTIGADVREDEVSVSIRDTGSGMVNGDLSRARDPFYTTKTYGTGMGLTLVEQILKQHNARFSLTANEDQGMTAQVIFPRDQ
ncbi:MAG: GAF domain-containing sensor histidine kinase [Desulfofustis sp.]|nr:GAF domain-containing sensor histidine kinase [Desulfofustis sp.]